ncbi:palmitoyltransferase swf1 [Anaeramoeba ignava]|uniref:Palmitoyltransferase n=1 Tax=Anaeramoeba ignava TaxID=1746090 RepID=A0A9Q0LN18_ANAIG|nr:palmitoyltransferase swf1 [Anaeramoeba ignava]
MDFFLFIFVYVGFLSFIVYVLLFGQSESNRNGFIGYVHSILTYEIWAFLKKMLVKIFGKSADTFLKKIVVYMCLTWNPFMMLFYVAILIGGFFVFFVWAFPEIIQIPTISSWNYVYIFLIIANVITTFLLCVFTDPGSITKDNVDIYLTHFPPDNLIFFPKFCETCKIQRPARSKHCRFVNKCVARYDHYCGWVANTMGLNNYRYFVLFLIANMIMCSYASYIIFRILYYNVKNSSILDLVFFDKYGNPSPISFSHILRYIIVEYRALFGLLIMVFMMGIVLFAFVAYHLYLIATNTTTNETFRYADLKEEIHMFENFKASQEQKD